MKKKLFYSIISCLLVLSSCTDLSNNLQNPSQPVPSQGNIDLVLNAVQLNFKDFYWDLSNIGAAMTRQEVMFGPLYKNAYNAQSYDAAWQDAYQGVLVNAKTVIDLAPAQKKYGHIAIARTIQAYTLMTLVDFFGDVPFSTAFGGAANTTPTLDAAKDIYTTAFAALDSATLNFNKGGVPAVDIYYNQNATKWKALVNTLKLKYYMNLGQDPASKAAAVAGIQSILAGDVIDDPTGAEDFVFSYGTTYTNPNSRHPKFQNNYTASGASDFFGTQFLYMATGVEKTVINGGSTIDDPRRRFYFYRQSGAAVSDVASTALPCKTQLAPAWYRNYQYWYPSNGMPFCQLGTLGISLGTGYWGRDHGDNSGIPPDGQLRTTYGLYPAGGLYDNGDFKAIGGADAYKLAGQGQGIAPIWLSSYTHFLKVEAALNMGANIGVSAATALAAGVKNSVEKVVSFTAPGVTIPASRITTLNGTGTGSKTAYYNYVNAAFAAAPATGPGGKLDLAMREFYIATFGNGIEAYNMYRRTGYPSGMQFVLAHDNTDAADPFVRSAYYPAVAVNRNASISQKPAVDTKVFWDQNLTLQ